jgi:hypothetical protein
MNSPERKLSPFYSLRSFCLPISQECSGYLTSPLFSNRNKKVPGLFIPGLLLLHPALSSRTSLLQGSDKCEWKEMCWAISYVVYNCELGSYIHCLSLMLRFFPLHINHPIRPSMIPQNYGTVYVREYLIWESPYHICGISPPLLSRTHPHPNLFSCHSAWPIKPK